MEVGIKSEPASPVKMSPTKAPKEETLSDDDEDIDVDDVPLVSKIIM